MSKERIQKAVAKGVLFDGLCDCFVLEDGERILSQRGIVRAISGGRDRGDLRDYLAALPSEFSFLGSAASVRFSQPSDGAPGIGRPAEFPRQGNLFH